MAESNGNEKLFSELVSALNRNDADGCVELFVEDCVFVDYTNPTVVVEGRIAIRDLLQDLFEQLKPKFEVDVLVAGENRLAAEYRIRPNAAGSTEPREVHYTGFYEFRDGKLLSEHIYYDKAQLLAAG